MTVFKNKEIKEIVIVQKYAYVKFQNQIPHKPLFDTNLC